MTDQTPGPVHPTSHATAALRPLPMTDMTFAPGGFLGGWQQRNADRSLPYCISQLDASGALDNLRRVTGEADGDYQNMWFADSDVYKTLEAAAWQLGRAPENAELRAFVDSAGALLAKAQDEDGYLNSHRMVVEPEKKWQDLHWSHELYCAGHLIQAAVAAARAGVGAELVTVARRFADLIVSRFGSVDDVDGHPEIETALVELYRVTGHRPYLDQARRFIDLRGHGLLNGDRFGSAYLQDHVPVRQADAVAGHVVRQLYLLAGVVDVAVETHDDELLDAAHRLWEDAFGAKTYVTGAQGSRHRDEAFGAPYELPSDRAYGETCAGIASFQWNWRMLLATGSAKYADEMERALYNVIAGSTAIDGTHFFYSNTLHLRTGHDGSHEDAPSQRLPWYSCACCPPNLARLLASLSGYAATASPGALQIHLYGQGELRTTVDGHPVHVAMRTEYPWDGKVELTVTTAAPMTLTLRIPGWSTDAQVDGTPVDGRYVHVRKDWSAGATVTLDLPMPARVVRPHPRIDAVRGCVALARGPLVYCLEQADLPDNVTLEDVRIVADAPITVVPGSPVTLTASGSVEPPASDELYPTHTTASHTGEPITLTATPYFLWGNRKPGPMRVWLPTPS
ncbi:glycoside hydrolase family 127 protein [Kibdelosporangium persicum]|uniref:Non-reducing end beta-L-arabinofuranosidase n=1 Tax=Kibdelosporangium persicum TaxID=2698649 RepID=A0ABX2F7R7_9PSEU|nr:beta-L-arabinofuranosidase domain-containing protein [Kibdelosporangium persicum]NRN66961.1 Non-reducing end beta-L-arabinofuranosidase [Kibdelosporangium persicum]